MLKRIVVWVMGRLGYEPCWCCGRWFLKREEWSKPHGQLCLACLYREG